MMTLFPHIPAAPLGCDGDLACGGSITATRAKVIKTVVTVSAVSSTASTDQITTSRQGPHRHHTSPDPAGHHQTSPDITRHHQTSDFKRPHQSHANVNERVLCHGFMCRYR